MYEQQEASGEMQAQQSEEREFYLYIIKKMNSLLTFYLLHLLNSDPPFFSHFYFLTALLHIAGELHTSQITKSESPPKGKPVTFDPLPLCP